MGLTGLKTFRGIRSFVLALIETEVCARANERFWSGANLWRSMKIPEETRSTWSHDIPSRPANMRVHIKEAINDN